MSKKGLTVNKKRASTTGVVLGALVAAAAGGYYFYKSKKGEKAKQRLRGWMLRAQGDILERLEKLPKASEQTYKKIVDDVSAQYRTYKQVDKDELKALGQELKDRWQNIAVELKASGKSVKKFHKRQTKK